MSLFTGVYGTGLLSVSRLGCCLQGTVPDAVNPHHEERPTAEPDSRAPVGTHR